MTIDESTSAPATAGPTTRAQLAQVVGLARTGWTRLAGFAGTFVLLAGLAALAEGIVLLTAFKLQASRLTVDGVVTWGGTRSMLLQTSVASVVVSGLVVAAGASCAVAVAQRLRAGEASSIGRSLRRGLRRTPVVLVAGLVTLGGFGVLLVATPLIVNVAALLLLLTPLQRRLARRRAGRADEHSEAGDTPTSTSRPDWVRWPSLRALVVAVIPFGALAVWATRTLLVLPAAVAIDGGLRATFAASARSVRGRAVTTWATMLSAVAVVGAAQFGVVALVRQADQTTLTVAAMALVLTVAYHGGDVAEPTPDPAPGERIATAWRTTRRPRLTTTVLAVTIGGLGVLLPLVQATPAAAAVAAVDSYVVDSLGDAGDADPGDGTCATADGTCTLRAAVEEGNTQQWGGDGNAITFTVGGNIALGSPISVMRSTTIDGSGQTITLDGGGATQLLRFEEGVSWGLRGLHLTRGRSDNGGGALYSGGAGVVDGVTFSENEAVEDSSGGAMSAYSSVTITNSTFHANVASGNGDAIAVEGSAEISHSTFTGSPGPIWAGFTVQLDDSIVESTGGAFACSVSPYGQLTGDGNRGNDDSCPGVPAGQPPLHLGSFGDHGGNVPTTRITADSSALDAGRGACPDIDARGVPRPQGAACDAGAFELDVRSTTTLSVDPSPSQPGQSVRLTATVTSDDGLSTAGTVTFTEGATTLGSSPVSDGKAVLVLATLASGPHTLTASYGGTGPLAPSSGTATHQVAVTSTPVTISSSANPAAFGTAVTITVDLQTVSATPGGTVVLKDGTSTLATLPVSSRTVTFTTSTLAVGPHALTAVYSGDASAGSGTSSTFAQTINGAGVVSLSAAPANVVFGNPVTLAAVVTSPDAAPPTSGTVRFQVEGTWTDVAVTSAGRATLVTSTLPPGSRTVYAQFLGGDGIGQSVPGSTVVDVADAPSSVALAASPVGPTDYGAEVTLTAVVTVTGSPAPVAGAVQFLDGTTLLGQVPLGADGRAELVTTALGVGTRSVTAAFVPATGFAASTSPVVTRQVDAVETVVALVSGTNPSTTGQAVTFTATVTGTGTTAVPTGSISFRDGATELSSVPLDATGVAQADIASLAVGSHAVIAVYSGADGFAAGTSPAVTQVVTRGATTVDLGTPASEPYGAAVTLSARVSPTAPATGVPTGTVIFRQGATLLGVAPTVDGVATLVRDDLDVAVYDVTATYGGSASFEGSADDATFEVYRRAATLTLTTDRPSSTYGEDVTLIATSATSAGIVPTGTVVFSDQSGSIGTAPLGADGVARLTVDHISAGDRSLDVFLDSPRFSADVARTTLTVAKATPTATLTVSPIPVVTDQQSILALDLTGAGGTKPSGHVTFTLDGDLLQRVLFGGGRAELGTVLPIGTHRVRAWYEGNADYEATPLVTVVVEVGKYVPTLIVRAEPSDAVVGELVTLRAEVRRAPGKPAATGTVTFRRNWQPVGSGTIDADGNVAITVSDLPFGTSTVAVHYEGDARYDEAHEDLEVRVDRPSTVTSLTPATSAPKVGQAVSYTVTVTNPRSPVSPVGRIDVRVDGVLVVQRLVTATGPSVSVTFLVAIAEPGDRQVVATFIPGDAQVLGSSAMITQAVTRYATATVVTAPSGTVEVGDVVPFTVAVRSVDPVDPGDASFRSQILVTDGAGGTCTVAGGSGTCSIRITAPGPRTITAVYAGDDLFAPSSGTLPLTVGAGATRITAFAYPTETERFGPWVTNDPIKVVWTVGGPTTGEIVVTTAGGRVFCRSTVEAGSCTNAFSLDELGSPVLTVAFVRTTAWSAATAQAGTAATLLGCFPIRVGTTTVGRGTAALAEAPDCGGGTGHREGSFATVVASPAPGFATEGFDPAEVSPLAGRANEGRFLISRTGPATLQGVDVRFGFDCVPLTQTLRGPVDLGQGAEGHAACTNRSSRDQNGDFVSWWWRGSTARVEVNGAFAGTDLSGVRVPSEFQAVAYQLDDDAGQPLGGGRYVLRFGMDQARDSFIRFGAPCFTLGLTTLGGAGTATANGTNCTGPIGQAGYAPTTPVTVKATAQGTATFKEWTGGAALPAGFSANGPVATFAIRADTKLVATFTSCYRLTTGIAGFPEDATITVDTEPTCANGQAGWYAEGTDAIVSWRTPYFAGWATDQPSTQSVGSGATQWTGTARFTMDRDKAAMLKAPNPGFCAPLSVTVQPAGAGTGVVAGLADPTYPCPPGQYAQSSPLVDTANPCLLQYLRGIASNPERRAYIEELYVGCMAKSTFEDGMKERRMQPQEVRFEAAAKAGAPLLGWSYTTSTPSWAADPTREAYGLAEPRAPREDRGSVGAVKEVDIFGATTATAWVCQQIDAKVLLRSPDGTLRAQSFQLGSEFIAVDPPPNCPIAANAWMVGTKVRVAPSAPAVGYTFEGWTGAYTGPSRVVELDLDGTAPKVRIDARYTITCHELKRTPVEHTSVSVAPNCPDAEPGTNSYIGGTRVGLTIKDRGQDFVFRGWSGAEGSANPTVVVMDADRSVTASWSEKNDFEKAIDWIDSAASTVGTFLSDHADAMQEASKVMAALAAKGVQIAWGMYFDQTFGVGALPLSALRLINLALDNPDLASVIDQYEKVLAITNISGMLLGCATDAVLGLLPSKDPPTAQAQLTQAATDAAALANPLVKRLDELRKTAEELEKAQEAAKTSATRFLGPAAALAGLSYGVGTSLAEGRILTSQPELNNAVIACIQDSMPTDLMDAVGRGLGL